MRCLVCTKLSLNIICKNCQNNFFDINLKKRILDNGLIIYSFYNYNEIKELINSKYYFFGDRVLKILASLSLKKFINNFKYNELLYIIPIDDRVKNDFSHSAILAKSLNGKNFNVIYNSLQSKNNIKFAGKSKKYRKTHKRNFIYKGKPNLKIILIDDIVTSGKTLSEAVEVLKLYNCEVLFALTLCDAKI